MERYRTTIIMLVALVALGGLAFFLGGRNGSSSATPTPTPVQYVWQEDSPVASIDVVSDTGKVSLRQDVSTTVWSLVEPIKDTADPFAVGGEADALKSLLASRVLTTPEALSNYGLESTKFRVDVATGGSSPKQHAILIGSTTVDGSGYYVKTPDSPTVYVVSNQVIEPMKGWLTTPPKVQPTATPAPITIVPTPPEASGTVTSTVTLPDVSPPVTSTGTTDLGASATITSTSPGAANATTPLPPTV